MGLFNQLVTGYWTSYNPVTKQLSYISNTRAHLRCLSIHDIFFCGISGILMILNHWTFWALWRMNGPTPTSVFLSTRWKKHVKNHRNDDLHFVCNGLVQYFTISEPDLTCWCSRLSMKFQWPFAFSCHAFGTPLYSTGSLSPLGSKSLIVNRDISRQGRLILWM